MSPLVAAALIAAGGVVLSGFVSMFVAGARWGSVTRQIDTLSTQQGTAASKDDVEAVNRRLDRIENLFVLKLRDGAG